MLACVTDKIPLTIELMFYYNLKLNSRCWIAVFLFPFVRGDQEGIFLYYYFFALSSSLFGKACPEQSERKGQEGNFPFPPVP